MDIILTKPLRFRPCLKETIWGGDAISSLKGWVPDGRKIGESWEISDVDGRESVLLCHQGNLTLRELIEKYGPLLVGEHVYERFGNRFPILVKFLDAKKDLSLQVHPGDEVAQKKHGSLGKTEMWFVIGANPGARIYAGLKMPLTPEKFNELVSEGKLLDAVRCHSSRPGDVYLLHPGYLHTLSGGNIVVEIQESSDITYRVDDFGRRDDNGVLRELHIDDAREVISYSDTSDCRTHPELEKNCSTVLAECDHFRVKYENVEGRRHFVNDMDSFIAVTVIDGEGMFRSGLETLEMKSGESMLVPASIKEFEIEGKVSFLSTTVP